MHKPAAIRPVRVLYVDHTAKIGGGEIAILNLTRSIDRSRFEPVFVVASHGAFVDRLNAAGMETHVLQLDPSVNDARKDTLGLKSLFKVREAYAVTLYIFRLARLMKKLNVSLVHTNSLKAHIFGGLAAKIAGLQVVWHIRDAIDDNYLPRVVASSVRFLARVLPNYIVTNSNSTLAKLQLDRNARTAVVYSGIESKQSNSTVAAFVVHDACDPISYDGSSSVVNTRRQQQRPTTITMVGRIAEWKGQHIFIGAASAVLKKRNDIVFQIVGAPLFGEQAYEQSIRNLTAELEIADYVQFLGFREDVPQIIANCDILVHASIIGEPFGQVVIEGMASAKPVVATNGGAIPEIIVDKESGMLVEMGSVDDMAEAITYLLEHPAFAETIGAAARQRVLNKFTLDRCAEQIHGVYEKMLLNKRHLSAS